MNLVTLLAVGQPVHLNRELMLKYVVGHFDSVVYDSGLDIFCR